MLNLAALPVPTVPHGCFSALELVNCSTCAELQLIGHKSCWGYTLLPEASQQEQHCYGSWLPLPLLCSFSISRRYRG